MSERVESLLVELLAAQQKTNVLLLELIRIQGGLLEALAEDGGDPDTAPATYIDGTPIR